MPRPVPVETAAVTKGRFVASVDEDGKTRVRERYVVAAPLAGRLTRVALKAGDKVAVRRCRCHHHAAAGAPARPAQPPRGRGKTGHRRGRAGAQQGRRRARAGPGRSGKDRSRSRPHACRAGCRQPRRRWNAPNSLQRVADRDLRAAEFQDHAAEPRGGSGEGTARPLSGWRGRADRTLEHHGAGIRRGAEGRAGKRDGGPVGRAAAGNRRSARPRNRDRRAQRRCG